MLKWQELTALHLQLRLLFVYRHVSLQVLVESHSPAGIKSQQGRQSEHTLLHQHLVNAAVCLGETGFYVIANPLHRLLTLHIRCYVVYLVEHEEHIAGITLEMFLEVFAVSLRKTTFATQIDNSLCLGGYVEGKLCRHSLVLQSRTIDYVHTICHQWQRAADNGICHILEACHAARLRKFLIVGIRILICSDKFLFADMFHTSCRYTAVCIYSVLEMNLHVILIAAILDEGENGCAWQSRLRQDAAS